MQALSARDTAEIELINKAKELHSALSLCDTLRGASKRMNESEGEASMFKVCYMHAYIHAYIHARCVIHCVAPPSA